MQFTNPSVLGPETAGLQDLTRNGFIEKILQIMDDIKAGLRYVFQTNNEVTLAVSATGHGGMETAMCNLVEPGDKVLVAVNGIWGRRAMDIASRYGT